MILRFIILSTISLSGIVRFLQGYMIDPSIRANPTSLIRRCGHAWKINDQSYLFVKQINLALASVFLSVASVQAVEFSSASKLMTGKTDAPYAFKYSEDLIESPKLVKTHQTELFLKSEKVKGYSVGLTVRTMHARYLPNEALIKLFVKIDPVKIDNIKKFTTPEKLADRVLAVERGKEGFIDGSVVSALGTDVSTEDGRIIPAYDLDYKVETTRGSNHFLVRTIIADKKLYVFTTQSKEDNYEELSPLMHEITSSFHL